MKSSGSVLALPDDRRALVRTAEGEVEIPKAEPETRKALARAVEGKDEDDTVSIKSEHEEDLQPSAYHIAPEAGKASGGWMESAIKKQRSNRRKFAKMRAEVQKKTLKDDDSKIIKKTLKNKTSTTKGKFEGRPEEHPKWPYSKKGPYETP